MLLNLNAQLDTNFQTRPQGPSRGFSPDHPPICNTGGTQRFASSPSTPSFEAADQKTIIDTISWTIPTPGKQGIGDEVKVIRNFVLANFPDGCEWTATSAGRHGYRYQTQLVANSLVLGWLAFGADHNGNWLYFTGAGLFHRRENGFDDNSLAVFSHFPRARLGRIDIALDIFDHSQFSVEQSIAAHEAGSYKLPRAPKSPHSELFQSDTNSPGYEVARTHYLGKRSATKRLRVYDKGLQVLGSLTRDELDEYRRLGVVRAATPPEDGRLEEWTRVELIYKHDKHRPLSCDMIVRRDDFFAGAYPPLQELLAKNDGVRPAYIPREEECEHARIIAAHQASYGGHIYFLRHNLGWTDKKIVDSLIGKRAAARLITDKERAE